MRTFRATYLAGSGRKLSELLQAENLPAADDLAYRKARQNGWRVKAVDEVKVRESD